MTSAPAKQFSLRPPSTQVAPQQLYFPSLAFPKDRSVLYVSEVAERLGVTDRHVANLLEEGSMIGFDVAGRFEFMRIPTAAVAALAARFAVSPLAILDVINATKPAQKSSNRFWRIPVKEGYEDFLAKNHSLAK